MIQKQVAESLEISTAVVGRYTKALTNHHSGFTQYIGGRRIYDVNAFRAIKYMNLLVVRGMLIDEAVIPVLRDIYSIDVAQQSEIICASCETKDALIEQQQAVIALLKEKLAER